MDTRLSYDETIKRLQALRYLDAGQSPPMPGHRPKWDDNEPLGVTFFRTLVREGNLGGLTLRRTCFARSEINRASFVDTDLSESTLCWNDFIAVDFSGAILANCDMRASIFVRCVFDNADLSGSDLRRSSFDGCTFKGAEMSRVVFAKSQVTKLAISDEQFAMINWQNSDGEEPPGG